MDALYEFLTSIPTWGLMALIWAIALLLAPLGKWIDYKIDCKKNGKEIADEIASRW